MKIRDFGAAWLIEILSLHRVPIFCLNQSPVAMNMWLNHGHHHLRLPDLVKILWQLYSGRYIEIFASPDDQTCYRPSRPQLIRALQGLDSNLQCAASKQGGNQWAIMANAKWARFYTDEWYDQSLTITTASVERLQELCANTRAIWGIEKRGEVKIEEIKSWKPLSWKSFAKAYSARLCYQRPFIPVNEQLLLGGNGLAIRSWANSICGVGNF
jgi:hypothetical protein